MRQTGSMPEQGDVQSPVDWGEFCKRVRAAGLRVKKLPDRAPFGPVEAESHHVLAHLARTLKQSLSRNSRATKKLLPCQHSRRTTAAENSLICTRRQTWP